jgi:hypothetical protein
MALPNDVKGAARCGDTGFSLVFGEPRLLGPAQEVVDVVDAK